MYVLPLLAQYSCSNNLCFTGREDTFWKIYKREKKGIPLKTAILESICSESNLLGEGSKKKGYSFVGLKNYVIRVYKNHFQNSDLAKEFIPPKKDNFLGTLEGVVLEIPGKIDIVKRKSGVSLGVQNYAKRLNIDSLIPMNDINITREESLKELSYYEKIKDFPLSSYISAYKQMKIFCSKSGFQFDIISPNNILVDLKSKRINLIDPVIPVVNEPVHGRDTNFANFHGCDSLYPTMCDFLMHKEHLSNLTVEEKQRWKNSINIIIAKCISAGKSLGLERNIDSLRVLYQRIECFWGTKELCRRYDSFIETYSGVTNQIQTANDALDYTNSASKRISAINKLAAASFEELAPVLQRILKAPHQPKVEFPEIINPVLDRILDYGKQANIMLPTLEELFKKEIFPPTKKRLYNIFIKIAPQNKLFLSELSKSASNPIEKVLFKDEFELLHNQVKNHETQTIYEIACQGEKLSKQLIDKIWVSRTCVSSSNVQKTAIDNMIKGYEYIQSQKNNIPNIDDLIKIHKIIFANISGQEFLAGKLRTPETDDLIRIIFSIKERPQKLVNDYSASCQVIDDINKLAKYIDDNHAKENPFILAAYIFNELIRIHPFLNGNGRAVRLFTEQLLLNKGFRLLKWPEELLYRKVYSNNEFADLLRCNSVSTN